MNKKLVSVLLAGSSLLAACDQSTTTTTTTTTTTPPPAATVSKDEAAAMVNGQPISKQTLENLQKEISRRNGGQNVPQKTLLDELIKQELLMQEASKSNLQNSPEIQARLDVIRRSLVSQAALQNYLDKNPITDDELKAEYDKKVAGENGIEYKARHILVKTEEEAKKLIEQLNKGAKFEDLAKKNSIEPGAKESGGELGWFSAGQMVEPFSKAVAALENGKYTTAPVQTQFGWHVVLREDSRKPEPPPFESVKEQLRPMLQREKIQTYMQSLRDQAKVEVLLPPEQPPAPPAETAEPVAPATAPAAPATTPVAPATAAPAPAESKAPAESAPAPAPEAPKGNK